MTDATTNLMPHRSSRGLPRSAQGGAPLATCDKLATAGSLKLRKPLSAGTWNVRSLWRTGHTGASRLLVEQLSAARINMMGLQEVRWLDSGEVNIDKFTLLWSGPPAGSPRHSGVALAIPLNCQVTHLVAPSQSTPAASRVSA